jgi:Terminase large subunit, T4likevirus-type, N-terminal
MEVWGVGIRVVVWYLDGVWCTFHQSGTWEGEQALAAPVPSVLEFARGRLGFEPDEQQARVLSSVSKRGILNCTRQWGKSTVAAIKAVHRAYTIPESLVIVVSSTERQSAEFLRKARGMVGKLGIRGRGDGANATSLLLPNGSRMVGLPCTDSTSRGYSAVGLLIVDEAARVPDEVYRALRPMLAVSDGELWMLSTPAGQRGFFWENWELGGEECERFSVPATECPRIGARFLEEERRQLGDASFRQEYMCEFADGQGRMFRRELIQAALVDIVPWKF